MLLRVFDTQLGAKGMEDICELQHYLVPLLMQRGSSHVLVIKFSHRVILLLDDIHKKIPSGLGPKYSRLLCVFFLLVSFPPMSNMGESLKVRKGDLFVVRKIVNIEITF